MGKGVVVPGQEEAYRRYRDRYPSSPSAPTLSPVHMYGSSMGLDADIAVAMAMGISCAAGNANSCDQPSSYDQSSSSGFDANNGGDTGGGGAGGSW